MSGELIAPTMLQHYGMEAKYGLIRLGNLELIAHKIDFYFDGGHNPVKPVDYVTMTVEYRAQSGDTRANFLITAGGWDQPSAVQEMKNQLDAIMENQE